MRKLQAIGLELLLGFACLLAGVAGIIPNKGLVYVLLNEFDYAKCISVAAVIIGIALCWAAVRAIRWLRVAAAYAANGVWVAVGYAYVSNTQFGLVLFLSCLFFVFNCIIAHERWE